MKRLKNNYEFEKLIKFVPPGRNGQKQRVTVKMNGKIRISPSIISSLKNEKKEAWADFRHSEDYKVIMMRKGKKGDFKLPSNGGMLFEEWEKVLENMGYSMPAVYCMEWDEAEEVWKGTLQEVAEAPSIV